MRKDSISEYLGETDWGRCWPFEEGDFLVALVEG